MKLTSITDIGVKRTNNQDNFWASRLNINGSEAGVICLCDGMGGLSNGALTSKIVAERVMQFFKKSIDFKELENIIKEANTYIYEVISKKGQSGTTCTILFCLNGEYKILHVGDSRCYRVSSSGVQLLTEDHTVIEKYRKQGRDLPDDLVKKYRNVLTRCVGAEKNVSLDYLEGTYSDGDYFLVCSDGFWHYLKESSFSNGDIFNLSLLVGKFKASGETDNITAGLLIV